MPTPRSAWVWIDLGPKMDFVEIANADTVLITAPIPVAGTIKECWIVGDVLPTAGTLVVSKAVGAVDATVVASVALQTALSTSNAILKVDAGNMLRALWTFGTIGSGDGFGCLVAVEPDTW
jgi:hypothetical protein